MSRPQKCRSVAFVPEVTYFKPAGIPLRALEEIQLSLEEVESIRLKDLEGMEQEPASERMNISRPTFQRILASARKKIAHALLNGKAIKIAGGNFKVTFHRFCRSCGYECNETLEAAEDSPVLCPACNTSGIKSYLSMDTGGRGKGRGRRRIV